jgi:transcriptional regulator with XRE-family HTH domain
MSVGAAQPKRILCVPSLAYWRKQRGLTAKRLFERSGIDDVWIEHLERGDWCRPETCAKLAEALQVEPDQLMAEPPQG